MTLFVLIFLCFSLLQIWFYRNQLHSCATHIKPLAPVTNVVASWEFPKISVIIPAYNEVANIQDCVTAVLGSTNLSAEQLEV